METEQNNRPFVREHIIPSKKKKQKEFLKSLGRMFLRGAVFGIAAGIFFVTTEQFLGQKKESEEYQTSNIITNANETENSLDNMEQVDVQNPADTHTNTETIKPPAKNEGDYANKINEWNQSIIAISIKSEWAGGQVVFKENTGFGIAIEKDTSKLYFLTRYTSLATGTGTLQAEFFDGFSCPASLTGKDEDADIAVISVDLEEIPKSIQEKVEILKMGDTGQIQTGNFIILLGKPNGSLYSTDIGIISGVPEKEYIMDYSLDIYPTNIIRNENGSGMAVSTEGKLLGILTDNGKTIFGKNIVAFSGISSLKRIITKIINREPIVFCGIRAENIPQKKRVDMGITNGIYVMETEPNSPAAQAGIHTGDIIQKVEDTEISSVIDFYTTISECEQNVPIAIHAVQVSGGKKKENKYIVRLQKKE